MSRQPTIIYSADNPQQAYLLRSLLADEGIKAWVVNDAIQIAGGELPIGWRGAAKVVVGDDEAVAARRFAESFDQKAQRNILEPDERDYERQTDNVSTGAADWPVCPECDQPRNARCPICAESGAHFPPAYALDADRTDASLFLCPSCDDAIHPEWYRLCARCGHDFGSGLQVENSPPSRPALSLRTVIVLVTLLALAITVAVYFLWLFAGGNS